MPSTTRRALLAAAPLAAALQVPTASAAGALSQGAFTHGVASGDPTASSVILWTRFAPSTPGVSTVGWEVADDTAFARVRARGTASVSPFDDHCVKVDAGGLQPGRPYYYRFLSASGASPIGETRTAPAGGGDTLSFALFSCSNKGFGYFHAYAHAAVREDIDVCLHVGDYLYEYGQDVYPSRQQAVAGRSIAPATEIVSLSDYHARYASYRADPALQEVHRRKPFMTVWDDHEIVNDAWIGGAENHQPDKEGDWVVRRAMAIKAYADWMPMRPQSSRLQIYRRFDWGNLATILMLDTRLIGRDQQLNLRTALAPAMATGETEIVKAVREIAAGPLSDEKRSLLGAAQEAWMRQEMQRSKARGATWQILAQQLVTSRTMFPAKAAAMVPENGGDRAKMYAAAGALLGREGIGFNMDAWSGYPKARDRFLQSCALDGSNAVVLAGDSHNAWWGNLPGGRDGRNAAIEIAGGSVTSPGMESSFSVAAPGAREAALLEANPELAWCDATNRGYAVATLTRTQCQTEWVAFDTVRTPEMPTPKVTRMSAEATRANGVGKWQIG